ncbi:spore coat protein U domain-containing protein [Ramlibacter sp. AN1133]|uniref:spore coat protein U domain-containing protein n=1 Tax=Ramlibacter sp. AN1133 TaxID=3133429 RepID=UPI0030C53998
MGGRSERGRRRRAALLAALMLAGSLSAHAASDSGALTVTATVVGRTGCLFLNSSNPTLDFGVIDQASTANATAATTVTVRCRGNIFVNWSIAVDNGLNPTGTGVRRLRHESIAGELMPYTLTVTPTNGFFFLFAGSRTIDVTGSIAPANFQPAAAGAYSDTVKLTLNF